MANDRSKFQGAAAVRRKRAKTAKTGPAALNIFDEVWRSAPMANPRRPEAIFAPYDGAFIASATSTAPLADRAERAASARYDSASYDSRTGGQLAVARAAPRPWRAWLATISTLMACMRTDRSNAELLAVVADLAQRFSAAVIGVAARQLSLHSSIMAIGPRRAARPRVRQISRAGGRRSKRSSGPPCQGWTIFSGARK